jgi:hypothetical protein
MKAPSLFRMTTLALLLFAPLSLWPTDCPKCDCSHFPISDPDCVKCCFAQKGTVTDSTGTSVTIAPISGDRRQPPKTFRVQKTTKINGELQQGAPATVYYHTVDGQDVATRVDGIDSVHGSLVPANLPSPRDTCEEIRERFKHEGMPVPAQAPADAMRIFLGNSEAYSTEQRLIFLTIDGDEVLVLQKTESGMSVSAKVRGPDGQLEAQIVDNEFFINPRNSFRMQGDGGSSLVVFSPQNQRILDIEFLNPHVIKILGNFFGPSGEKVKIDEDQQSYTSSNGAKFISSHDCFHAGTWGFIELLPTGLQIR